VNSHNWDNVLVLGEVALRCLRHVGAVLHDIVLDLSVS
jgi:hypothetical protein